MRVSVIDEKTIKDIDRRRRACATLLTKFSFGLAGQYAVDARHCTRVVRVGVEAQQ